MCDSFLNAVGKTRLHLAEACDNSLPKRRKEGIICRQEAVQQEQIKPPHWCQKGQGSIKNFQKLKPTSVIVSEGTSVIDLGRRLSSGQRLQRKY